MSLFLGRGAGYEFRVLVYSVISNGVRNLFDSCHSRESGNPKREMKAVPSLKFITKAKVSCPDSIDVIYHVSFLFF